MAIVDVNEGFKDYNFPKVNIVSTVKPPNNVVKSS